MLDPEEFQDEYPADELREHLPDEPITSLRDVQYLYGKLYTLATTGSSDYAEYLTPDQAADLVDEPESLIVVRLDLTDNDEPRLDADDPVAVTRYSEDLVEDVAHCKYNAARGIDHSVTHQAGQGSDPDKLARYAKERLTKWATDEVVQQAAADHDDGWIVDAMATVGEDEAALDRIEDAVHEKLGGPTTALVTVRVKTDEDGGYRWPGDVPVFNEAMRERKLSKLVSKAAATDSVGESRGLVTDVESRTVGTAEDPLNYYLGKQLETFPGFDADEAWRTHPISEDAAVTIMRAEPLIDACTYNAFGATIYYLPYFLGRITPEETYVLYSVLTAVREDERLTPVERLYQERGAGRLEGHEDSLRFYVAAIQRHQMSRYDVFGDSMNGRLLYPVELERHHNEVLRSWIFDVDEDSDEPIAAPLPVDENWPLLRTSGTIETIATGYYFEATFSRTGDEQDADADDARIEALVSVLSGEPIAVETLFEEYVERLLDEEPGEGFPDYVVASQYAQLCALANADLLTTTDGESYGPIVDQPAYTDASPMEPDSILRTDGGVPTAQLRADKLEQFIDETAAFDGDPERRGAFLLGALVGQIGAYQQSQNRSTTLVDQYSIKSMTQNKVKRITQEVLDKDVVYSREQGLGSTMYAEVVDRLVETMSEEDPENWELSTPDLRFYYALGVSYGMNNWIEQDDEPTADDD